MEIRSEDFEISFKLIENVQNTDKVSEYFTLLTVKNNERDYIIFKKKKIIQMKIQNDILKLPKEGIEVKHEFCLNEERCIIYEAKKYIWQIEHILDIKKKTLVPKCIFYLNHRVNNIYQNFINFIKKEKIKDDIKKIINEDKELEVPNELIDHISYLVLNKTEIKKEKESTKIIIKKKLFGIDTFFFEISISNKIKIKLRENLDGFYILNKYGFLKNTSSCATVSDEVRIDNGEFIINGTNVQYFWICDLDNTLIKTKIERISSC